MIGGSRPSKNWGQKYKEELAFGAKFRDQFLSPETVQFLDANGLLSHPLVVKDFVKAGKMLAEDNIVSGSDKGGGTKTPAQIIYPDMK